jgi:hypothetical protein
MEGSQQTQAPPGQQPYQPPYYPQAYPPAQPKPPAPIPPTFLWLALVGIIILVVGLMIGSANVFADTYETAENMRAIGNIIGEIGGLLLVLGLIVPAFTVKELDPLVRAGLFISMALVAGLLVLSV